MQSYQDLKDNVSRAWQDQSGYEQHNTGGGGIKRAREDEEDDDEYEKNEGTRSKYKCGLCGQPKKGHSCSAHKAAAEQFWGTRSYPPAASFVGASASYTMTNKRMVLISKLRERLERRVFGQTDNGAAHARFVQPGFAMQGGVSVEQMYGAPAQNNVQAQDGGYYQQWAGGYVPPQSAGGQVQPPQQPQSGGGIYPWFTMQGLQQPGSGSGAFNAMGAYQQVQYADQAHFGQEQLLETPAAGGGKGRGRGKARRPKA